VNTEQQDVDVRISSFSELANTDCPLALDNYQRAFVWGDKKINQLLDDLHSFIEAISDLSVGKGTGQPQNYYMGALLIHHQVVNGGPKRFVIDGQQRLTSLAVLYWLLN
jgi:uncharacterized protein with ParB-like and HNH nuclease domain